MTLELLEHARKRIHTRDPHWASGIAEALELRRAGNTLAWLREVAEIVKRAMPDAKRQKAEVLLGRYDAECRRPDEDLVGAGEALWITQEPGDLFQRAISRLYWATAAKLAQNRRDYLAQSTFAGWLLLESAAGQAEVLEKALNEAERLLLSQDREGQSES